MFSNILIIQTAFLGDVILTTPLIRALRTHFPAAKIDFLTIPASFNLLETNPELNQLIVFDKRGKDKGVRGLIKFSKTLRQNDYDLCITPHRSFRSAVLARKTAAKVRIGFNTSALSMAFTNIVKYRAEQHEVWRNLSLLSALDIEQPVLLPELYADETDEKNIAEVYSKYKLDHQIPTIALAPGSVWATKRWPLERYKKLAELFIKKGFRVVLIGSTQDKANCESIRGQIPAVVNLAGTLSLRQSFRLLCDCDALVTNDSAPLHMGLAAQTEVFAIFGATVPEFGFAPYGPRGHVIENKPLACRPCGIHGGHKCPTGLFDCMLEISSEQVFEKVIAQINNS